ncbi:hypothetical protein MBM_05927 [Drepanopeziza brunnea f. sp. 'multigermtubi' MB_m1]|uniref:Uncharacterized protein n=1 Tax=Marssonina brunnea f. sp. multigermtubi (strain MB_m1) TaxID=1072389 RepID=K1WS86_MARBU|nr:uncharacterized protein MBM_05927 [Drepanopeziza brunnea f. sp. 'multigermtubi' MB_m1]EKD15916.1 hypothetical protein MBM_05927 [Drepanopeziza brunnea f. sp. 'multigermtubi' MB_m1]
MPASHLPYPDCTFTNSSQKPLVAPVETERKRYEDSSRASATAIRFAGALVTEAPASGSRPVEIVSSCGLCQQRARHPTNNLLTPTRADQSTCDALYQILDTQTPLRNILGDRFLGPANGRYHRSTRRYPSTRSALSELEVEIIVLSLLHPPRSPAGDTGAVGKSCGEVIQASPDIQI